ncbi:MAG: hypothetical protein RLZZ367_1324 [Bacteroidota bacterium]|jgi:hypothetical protein
MHQRGRLSQAFAKKDPAANQIYLLYIHSRGPPCLFSLHMRLNVTCFLPFYCFLYTICISNSSSSVAGLEPGDEDVNGQAFVMPNYPRGQSNILVIYSQQGAAMLIFFTHGAERNLFSIFLLFPIHHLYFPYAVTLTASGCFISLILLFGKSIFARPSSSANYLHSPLNFTL